MKFLALACVTVLVFATLDERKVELSVHRSIADLPDKVHKTYKFLEPHLKETEAVLKKNAKEIAVKAKPHYEKAKIDFKAKQVERRQKFQKKGAEFKKKCADFGESIKGIKDINVEITHKTKGSTVCTAPPPVPEPAPSC